MKTTLQPLLSLLCWGLAAYAADSHPVEKVITLLNNLIDKVESEGKQEEATYAQFENWCTASIRQAEKAVTTGRDTVESLSDRVQSQKEEISLLEEQIAALDDERMKLQAAGISADNVRSTAAATYSEADKDFNASIDAVNQAIAALEAAETATIVSARSGDNSSDDAVDDDDEDALLFAQAKVSRVLALASAATEEQRNVLTSFVQQPRTVRAAGDYSEHIDRYSFKSGSVLELLKSLKLKFEDEMREAQAGETASINSYELAKEAREDLDNKASKSKQAKMTAKSNAQEARNDAEASLNSTRDELAADTATASQTRKVCTVKKSEWEERSTTRSNELEAMKVAIKILAKVAGVRTEAPTNPVLPPNPAALLQLDLDSVADPRQKALQLLRASAKQAHSHALARLAQELATHLTGPFDQVINMIQKMIFHLQSEQTDEDKHKNWCDLEMNKTDVSIADKGDKMDEQQAKITDAQATVQTLSTAIKEANRMVEDLTAHMQEATRIREDGKQENKEALSDAQDAQAAISSAIAVLEAFYKKSGMMPKADYELMQRGVDLPPEPSTWGASYTGTSDPENQPDGIITVLKSVSADFASMEAQTKAQEESDQKNFEEDMKLSEIEKTRRLKEGELKSEEKKRLIDKIASLTASRKHVSNEKEATEQYLSDLQRACVDGDSTYEDRKAARSGEIEALRQAQGFLGQAFEANSVTSASSNSSESNSTNSSGSFLSRRFLLHKRH